MELAPNSTAFANDSCPGLIAKPLLVSFITFSISLQIFTIASEFVAYIKLITHFSLSQHPPGTHGLIHIKHVIEIQENEQLMAHQLVIVLKVLSSNVELL